MKVVYILPVSSGAMPHYTAELANAVSKYAHTVVIKPEDSNDCLFSKDVEVIKAFQPIYLPKKHQIKALSLTNVKNLFSFRNIKIITEINPDVIHFTNLYPHISFVTFLNKSIIKKFPTICTLHSTLTLRELSPAKFGFVGSLLQFISIFTRRLVKPDKIIVHTEENRKILIEMGIPSKKVAIIPHGSYTFFRSYAHIEVSKHENAVLFFGYIIRNKGVEYLIKAAPIVSKEVPDIKIIIAGEGDLSSYRELVDKSIFDVYNEFLPNEKVAELFQRAKIVVLPYIYHQGHSGVLNIAFAFGKPVVVTDVGDLPNLVDNGKIGLIVPPKDPEALAEAIVKLLKDDELRERMSKNSHKKAQELSWDNIAKMHLKVYEETIKEHLGSKSNDKIP